MYFRNGFRFVFLEIILYLGKILCIFISFTKCRLPKRLKCTIVAFSNGDGFTIKVLILTVLMFEGCLDKLAFCVNLHANNFTLIEIHDHLYDKKLTFMYCMETSLDVMIPNNGNRTSGSNDVTAIGSASVIQNTAISSNT